MEYLIFMPQDTETQTQSTPMGRVWLVVFFSMSVTLGIAWSWHISGMNDLERKNKTADDTVRASTERITLYRNVLKEGGQKAGEAYFATSTP